MAKTKKIKKTRQQINQEFIENEINTDNEIWNKLGIFDQITNKIDSLISILFRNGENNLNRTFNDKEADDFLKRFSK